MSENFSKQDSMIVIAGSNHDIVQGKEKLMLDINRPKLINCTKHDNLQIAGLPYRHHSPSLNNRVSLLNIVIENLVNHVTQASFLTINDLPRVFTKHGLHFFP